MTDEKRADGMWMVRWEHEPWACVEVEGLRVKFTNGGLTPIGDLGIEWGPYLGNSPLEALAGIVDWLKAHGDMTDDELARAMLKPVLDDIDRETAAAEQDGSGPGSFNRIMAVVDGGDSDERA